MSEKSVINLYFGDTLVTSIGKRWGASSYALAGQIEEIAKILNGKPAKSAEEVADSIGKLINNPESLIYGIEKNHIPEAEREAAWSMDLDLQKDSVDILYVADLYERRDLEDDEDVDIDRIPDMPNTMISWEQARNMTDIMDRMCEENNTEYFRDPEDEDSFIYFS